MDAVLRPPHVLFSSVVVFEDLFIHLLQKAETRKLLLVHSLQRLKQSGQGHTDAIGTSPVGKRSPKDLGRHLWPSWGASAVSSPRAE